MVKSTPRLSLYYFVYQRWDRWHRGRKVTLIVMWWWRHDASPHCHIITFTKKCRSGVAYPIVRIHFVTVLNTFIAVYRHANCLGRITSHRDTFDVTRDVNAMTCRQIVSVIMKRTCVPINFRKMKVVSSTVHEIFNKHRLWVSQTQRECRCYKQRASSAGLAQFLWKAIIIYYVPREPK